MRHRLLQLISVIGFAFLGLTGCESAEPEGESGASEVLVTESEGEEEAPSGVIPGTGGVAEGSVGNEPATPEEETPIEPVEEEEEESFILTPEKEPSEAILCPTGNCYSSVDEVVLEHFAEKGVEAVEEETARLCRRLAVDLWGRIPSWLEVEQNCIGKSPHEMVDAFMDNPLYVFHSQQLWADEFQYHDGVVWWEYIKDLDEMVAMLYRAELSYEAFATAALIHPAFISRYAGEMRVTNAFRIFMERDALVSERKDLIKAWHIWDLRETYDPEWQLMYNEVVVDTRKCAGSTNKALCTATSYGGAQVVLPLIDSLDPASDINVLSISNLSEEAIAILSAPGKMLVGTDTFYEALVDKTITRFLQYSPDQLFGAAIQLIPELRLQLVEVLMASDGNIRALERELLTSLLYVQNAQLQEGDSNTDEFPYNDFEANGMIDRTYWAFGPTKQMRVEDWMASVQQATGYGHTEAWTEGQVDVLTEAAIGRCDHRYPEMEPGGPEEAMIYHPSAYPIADPAINRPDFMFRDYARNLGGCPNHDTFVRFTGYGVILSLEVARLINSACNSAASVAMFPPGYNEFDISNDGLKKVIRHQYRNGLSRDPTDDEMEIILEAMQGCLANTDICKPDMLARKVCTGLLRTSDFLFY